MPYFFKGIYYISYRPRFFLLFPIIILVSYGIYYTLLRQIRIPKKFMYIPILIIVLLTSSYAMENYNQYKKGYSYQNIPIQRYEAYKWVTENTPKLAIIYNIGGYGQNAELFMRRYIYNVDPNMINSAIQEHNDTSTFPLSFKGHWRMGPAVTYYFESLFEFDYYRKPTHIPKITDLDYIYFENLNQQYANFNIALAQYLINNQSFIPVFNNNFAFILKNGKKN